MLDSIMLLLINRTAVETDPAKLAQIYASYSLLEGYGLTYRQADTSKDLALAALWSNVQSDMDSHGDIYLDSGVPSDVVDDISAVYLATR